MTVRVGKPTSSSPTGAGITDTGWADKNEVITAQNPGQVAPSLHVSCSDKIDANERPTNSNLGATADGSERLIANYLIIKDVSKPNSKTCGDATPIPATARLDCFLPVGGVAGAIGLLGGGAAGVSQHLLADLTAGRVTAWPSRPRHARLTSVFLAGVVVVGLGALGLDLTVIAAATLVQAIFAVYFLRHLTFAVSALQTG